MTKKNAKGFLLDERQRYCNALLTLKQTIEPGHILSKYDEFVASRDIADQILTTVGYENRVGRIESDNDFVDAILKISHISNQVNSVRGVQLGNDNIEIFVNDTSIDTLVKTQEISSP